MAEHPAGHLVLKWLIEQDLTMAEAGKEGKNPAVYLGPANISAFVQILFSQLLVQFLKFYEGNASLCQI